MRNQSLDNRNGRATASIAAAILMAGAMAIAPGCESARVMDGLEFPVQKERGHYADVQVARDVTEISFTNTSATNLPPGRIWANSAFWNEFPGLGVGESITLDLAAFRNQFNEKFRAGGFFATERPDSLVRVQIETPESLIGLTVVRDRVY